MTRIWTAPALLLAALIMLPVTDAGALEFEFAGASEAPMENPHDIKLSPDRRHLYVSDVGNDRVLILDADTLRYIAAFGSDEQDGTHDIDLDADGRLYVADTHNGRILIYRLDGTDATLSGELSGGFSGPEGVLVHPNGRVYVAGAWSGNVVAFEDGRPVAELGGLSAPHDVELAPGNDIWLADSGNDRMLLLTPELKIKRELRGPPYDFDGVRYQDVMPDGTLIAADKNSHSVKVIGPGGELITVLGGGGAGKGPGRFRTPEGIEYHDGMLWISDSGNDRIVKYRVRH